MPRSQKIFISSGDRVSGTSENFKIIFPDGLIKATDNETISIKLVDFICNFSFYTIEEINNQFQVNETDSLGNHYSQVITVTPGNYDVNSFSAYLLNVLNNSPLYKYTMTNNLIYNLWTFQAVIKVSGNRGTIVFDFSNPSFIESLAVAMGFTVGSVNNFIPTVADTLALFSDAVVNMNSHNAIFLRGDSLFCNNVNFNHSTKNYGPGNIFGKIAITNQPFSKIAYYDINNNYEVIVDRKSISEMNFSLTDSYNNIINLNQHNFNFTLDIIYREIETKEDILLKKIDKITSVIENLYKLIRSDVLLRHKIPTSDSPSEI